MNHLTCFIPDLTDATSFYRAIGPLGQLRKQIPDLIVHLTDSSNWAILSMTDRVFMQRPASVEHMRIAEQCKAMSKPLWIDFDDDLFDLPTDNPGYGYYQRGEIRQAMMGLIQMADHITVSTQDLADSPQFREVKPIVIPNAFNQDIFGPLKFVENKPKKILWRGSGTHDRDLNYYGEAIIKFSKYYPEWSWTFAGHHPWKIFEEMQCKEKQSVPAVDIINYHQFLKTGNFAIMCVPLHDSHFNRAKSNIACMEATFGGMATLAPDFREWQIPGITTYQNKADFYSQLVSLAETERTRKEAWTLSAGHIPLLKDVNLKRRAILETPQTGL